MDNLEISRSNMVRNQVRVVGLEDRRILTAMLEIPRHEFVLDKFKGVAYSDAELLMDNGRMLARPEMTARFLETAQITNEDVVLEIGCGTGYASNIIARMAQSVVAIDNCKKLINIARKLANNIPNLAFEYQNFSKLEIQNNVSLVLINGAILDTTADLSGVSDTNDIFNLKSAVLLSRALSKMPESCRLFCVEGYYKYAPMNVVRYTKSSREMMEQIYMPEIKLV